MNSNNLEYLTTVKKEYQEQLVSILSKQIYTGIKQLYNDVKKQCMKTRDRNIMAKFQEQMSLVSQWSNDLVGRETQRIIQKSQCEYLPDLIAAVFLSNTKILSATSKKKQIDVDVPTLSIFVHGIYKEVARSLYSNPELIRDYDLDKWEQQRNYRECKVLIDKAIEETIRKHLPFKNILSNYLEFSINDVEEEPIKSKNSKYGGRRKVYQSDDEESLESYASWDSDSFTETDIEDEIIQQNNNKTNIEEIIVDDNEKDIVEKDIVEEGIVEEDIVEEDIVEEDIVEEDDKENSDDDEVIIEEEIIGDNIIEENIQKDEEEIIENEEEVIENEEEVIIEKENLILDEDDIVEEEIEIDNIIEEEIKEENIEIPVIEEEIEEENIEIPIIEENIEENIEEEIEEVLITDDFNQTTDIMLYDTANNEKIQEEIRKIPISNNARRNLGLVKNLDNKLKKSKKTQKKEIKKKSKTMKALFFPDLESDDEF